MATYLDLVNDVLDELNESRIVTVGSNTGVQRLAEKFVLKAVRDIINKEKEWPFLYASQSQTATAGTYKYSLVSGWTSIDWDTFFIESPVGTAASSYIAKPLVYMDFDQWFQNRKTDDEDGITRKTTSRGEPDFIIRSPDDSFIISPNPDKAYVVTYAAWVKPTEMSSDSDTPSIPSEWKNAILELALMYAYRFRNHDQEMFLARDNAKGIIKSMRTKLINQPTTMKNRMVANNQVLAASLTTKL